MVDTWYMVASGNKGPLLRYGLPLAALFVAIAARWLLDPLLDDAVPVVTLYAAIAFSVWFGGYGPAILVAALGYLALAHLFIEPDGIRGLGETGNLVSTVPFLITSLLIVGLGEAARLAGRRTRQAELEAARRQADMLHVTFASIGDAVMTADGDGRVTFLNPVAQQLTGWTHAEALGKPLTTVFPIVNERTRRPAEDPVAKVLRFGQVCGLANHTVLIHRDGSETPIDDSAAPIRRQSDGSITGVVLVFRDVTQRRRLENEKAARLEAARRLASIVESSDDAIISKSLDGIIQSWNAAAERIFGYSAEQAIGKHISLIIPPERADEEQRIISRLRAGKRVEHFETVRIRSDGQPVDVSLTISPLTDDTGRVVGASKTARDITDRKRAEEARQRHEQQLQLITDAAPALISYIDPDQRYRFANAQYLNWVGRQADQVIGMTMTELLGETAMTRIRPHVEQVLRGEAVRYEAEVAYQQGGVRWIDAHYVPDRDAAGEVIGFFALVLDITDRKRAEQALREREERYALVIAGADAAIWDWDVPHQRVLYSPQWKQMRGFADDDVSDSQDEWKRGIHPDDLDRVMSGVQAHFDGRTSIYVEEYRVRHKDGHWIWILDRGLAQRDASGRVLRMAGSETDITERKRVEEGLRFLAEASTELTKLADYKSTLQKVAGLAVPTFADWCAVDVIDDDGQLQRLAVVHTDPSKVQLAKEVSARYPQPAKAAHGSQKIYRTGRSEMFEDISDAVLRRVAIDDEHLCILRELGLRSYIGVPLRARGAIRGVISFIRAESGRRYSAADLAFAEELAHRAAVAIENAELYQQLRDADRRKDEFLATLAHELRNPLAPISNALEILKRADGNSELIQQARDTMDRQLGHLVRLVDDLLDVSRITRDRLELRKERIDLADVLRQVVDTCRPLADRENQRLEATLPDRPIRLDADPVRLAQVFSNLVHNACKYTEPGGTIRVHARSLEGQLIVSVQDSGIGIAPDALPTVFDMFTQAHRSLERAVGGLGIGLTLVKRLVEMHGGSVEARSEGPGRGSEFVVRLPVSDAVAAAAPLAPASPSAPSPPRRVLVVDDNRDAALSLAMLLRVAGHQTQTAHDGEEAVEAADAFRPDYMLLDIGLPKRNGYDVCRAIRQQPWGKSMVIVALTGWGQDEDRRRSQEAGFNGHLVKPVEHDALARMLADRQPLPA